MTQWFCSSISSRTDGGKLLFTAMIDRAQTVPSEAGKYRVLPLTTRGWQWLDGAQRKSKTPSSGFSQSLRLLEWQERREDLSDREKAKEVCPSHLSFYSLECSQTPEWGLRQREFTNFLHISCQRQSFFCLYEVMLLKNSLTLSASVLLFINDALKHLFTVLF